MKPTQRLLVTAFAAALVPVTVNAQEGAVSLAEATLAGDETITTPNGTIELRESYPTDESSRLLFDAMDLQRACQAYVWSTPLASFTTWRDQPAGVQSPANRLFGGTP